jgi:hypothetical protein
MRPEQQKALEYLDRKGTRLTAREVRERVGAAFAATEEFLAGVSEAEARRAPAPGEWSVQEIVDHLVETHRPSVGELRGLLRGERPPGGPIPASLQSAAPMGRPWPALVAELRRLHAEVLDTLERVPEELRSAARAPVVMVINAREPDGSERPLSWVEELDWKAYAVIFRLHEIDHLKQARRALARAPGDG